MPALPLGFRRELQTTTVYLELFGIHSTQRAYGLRHILLQYLPLHIVADTLPPRQLADSAGRLHIDGLRTEARRIGINNLAPLLAPENSSGGRRQGLGCREAGKKHRERPMGQQAEGSDRHEWMRINVHNDNFKDKGVQDDRPIPCKKIGATSSGLDLATKLSSRISHESATLKPTRKTASDSRH